MEKLVIDGGYGEGGGSIVRFSAALAILLNQPIKIINIRANRPKPGLRVQHLAGIKAIHKIKGGSLSGARLGSTEIILIPDKGNYCQETNIQLKIPTAGSLGLIFQILQLALCRTQIPIGVEINGGATYGAWSPSIDYIQEVTIPTLNKFGFNSFIEVDNHGFYPKGGARVKFNFLPPSQEKPLDLDENSHLTSINGVSIASISLKSAQVADRIAQSTIRSLSNSFPNIKINIEINYVDSYSTGCGLTLWTSQTAVPFGTSIVGKKGVSSEKIGKIGAANFIKNWYYKAAVDEYLSDQVIPVLGLLSPSSILTGPLTDHTKTNIWVTEQFFGKKFQIKSLKKDLFLIKSI
ncbi:MAG: RNA 3'-terminal phosphate cyclase [Candidatus Hodarchaeales archaeon]|jgi:RNA 3'-terminal phosphate cyclase (ATP)/RNA 3'-terminal phosphate cyclase (GTP)